MMSTPLATRKSGPFTLLVTVLEDQDYLVLKVQSGNTLPVREESMENPTHASRFPDVRP